MKVVLTHGYFIQEDAKEQEIMRPYPPLGLLYLSAFLEENKFEHHLFDSTFSSEEKWLSFMQEKQPDVIALYTNLMTKVKLLSLIKKLKSDPNLANTKILMGGPDVTYNWENYLTHGADFLVIGEGEETFLEFCQTFYGDKKYSSIPGLAFLNQEGGMVKNQPRIKIRNVDELPMPNRKRINLEDYLQVWQTHHGKRTVNVSTQRGCPYTCQWCSTAVYGQSYRRRNPKLVVDEIEHLIEEYQIEAIWFVDDVFTVSHKWIDAFVEEMQARNLKIDFECISRAERMNEDIIRKLKSVGCFRIWIGAESGSQRIIDLMDRKVEIKNVREMMQLTKKIGVETGTFIMLGYPTETKEDITQTIDYLKAANPDHFTITLAYPIKGTGLYEQIEPIITEKPAWESSTDREIDFKRTYPRPFYDFAIRKVVNEVRFQQLKSKGSLLSISALKHKAKALISSYQMKTFYS
jgi:radical SAM superfamily enzyme YgiQ (UPF0313 family)